MKKTEWCKGWTRMLGCAVLLVLATSAPARAQVPLPPAVSDYATAGIVEVEGGVEFNYVRIDDESTTRIGLNPAVRYFVRDGLAVGLRFGYLWTEDGPHVMTVLPQAEYNHNLGSRLFPYAALGVGLQYASEGEEGGASDTSFLIEPGVGVKATFGGGLVGLGVHLPITFGEPTQLGVNVLSRYAIFF